MLIGFGSGVATNIWSWATIMYIKIKLLDQELSAKKLLDKHDIEKQAFIQKSMLKIIVIPS